MKSKVLMVAVIGLCVSSLAMATAADRLSAQNAYEYTGAERANGTLGPLNFSIAQVATYLQVQVDVSVNTTGGSQTSALQNIKIYGQVYDAPWSAHTWSDHGSQIAPPGAGGYSGSWIFSVPTNQITYQGYGNALAGFYPGTPGGTNTAGFWYTQLTSNYPGPTLYISGTVPPTATPDPNAGGNPVPTMNRYGIIAMIVLLVGVALLVITRRK